MLYFFAAMPLAVILKANISEFEVADFAIAAIIILWFFRSRKPQAEKRLFRYFSPIIKPFIAFLVWALFTSLMAFAHVDSVGLLSMVLKIIKLVAYMFIFWIMVTEGIRKRQAHRYIFAGFVCALALNAIFILRGIEGGGSVENISSSNYEAQQGDNAQIDTSRRGGLTSANPTGSIIACYLILLIAAFMRKKTVVVGVVIAMLLYELLVGQSRGAWVTFLFGLILFWGGSRYRVAGLMTLLIIIVFGSNLTIVRTRLFTPQEGSYDGERGEIALMYLKRMNEDPIMGKGFYGRFYRNDLAASGSHNQYLQVMIETGFVGIALYLYALGRMGKFIKNIPDTLARKLLVIIFATQLFSVLSGEFWYSGPVFCAQLMLYAFVFIENNRETLEQLTAARRQSVAESSYRPAIVHEGW